MLASAVVLGVGNSLHSDDGAGPYLAETLVGKNPNIQAFNCGTAPENFTGIVRKINPEMLIIVDASLMDLMPGSIRRIPIEKIEDTAIGTHMMPLSTLVTFLKEDVSQIIVLGIQPASLETGEELSSNVKEAVKISAEIILSGNLESIPFL